MTKWLGRFSEDILLLAGCACVLYGLSLWNAVITWIVAGLMLIGFGLLIGKAKAKNAAD
jgi:hypothetical protein